MAWFVVMSKSIGPREAIRGIESKNLAWMKENHDNGNVLFSGPTQQGVGIWVVSHGDIYVGEVSKTSYEGGIFRPGCHTIQKFRRV
jgi:hypothetical protein